MTGVNLDGYSFGCFTVIKEAPHHIRADGKKVRVWECRCVCGNTRLLNKQEIMSQKRKSCGCKHDEYARAQATVHGDSHKRLHNIWSGMRSRCYNQNEYHYRWYGERGIKMCDEWVDNYVAFKEWAVNNGYSDTLTIDRINVDGDYCPDNCRWVTMKAQCNNRTDNHRVSVFGGLYTLSQLEEKTGIKQETIRRRLKRGWSAEEAVTKSVRRNKEKISVNSVCEVQYV